MENVYIKLKCVKKKETNYYIQQAILNYPNSIIQILYKRWLYILSRGSVLFVSNQGEPLTSSYTLEIRQVRFDSPTHEYTIKIWILINFYPGKICKTGNV